MLDWLTQANVDSTSIDATNLAIRLLLAALSGCFIAWLYSWNRGPNHGTASFPLTLIFLAILIAMVTQVVGNHIARAFSLVGALSIVRFRTVVDDTLDIGFVIFAVVVGMALGAGNFDVALLGGSIMSLLIVASKWILTRNGPPSNPTMGRLTFKTPIADASGSNQVEQLLAEQGISYRIIAAESARGGTMMEWTYEIPNASLFDTTSIPIALASIASIQSISWKVTER